MIFRKLEPLFDGFRYDYLIKRMLSMRLISEQKIKIAPQKKLCVVPWGPFLKG